MKRLSKTQLMWLRILAKQDKAILPPVTCEVLLKRGFIEHAIFSFYRITEAGRAAFADHTETADERHAELVRRVDLVRSGRAKTLSLAEVEESLRVDGVLRPKVSSRQKCPTCKHRRPILFPGQAEDDYQEDAAWCPKCGTLVIIHERKPEVVHVPTAYAALKASDRRKAR